MGTRTRTAAAMGGVAEQGGTICKASFVAGRGRQPTCFPSRISRRRDVAAFLLVEKAACVVAGAPGARRSHE
jgi:hypothetical protein